MTITPAQLESRRRGLGGSDALCYGTGADPRKSRFQLWQEKTAEPLPEQPQNAPTQGLTGSRIGESVTFHQNANRMDWGTRLEPVLVDWLAGELGRPIDTPNEHNPMEFWREDDHFERPFMVGHLDGLTASPMEIVEAKAVDKFQAQEYGDAGTDQVPVRHVLQCHHYMLCTGIKLAHLVALIGGNDARHYVIPFDAEIGDMLLERARIFWQYVVDKRPPPPSTLDDVTARWPASVERAIKADSQAMTQLLELTHQRQLEADAKAAGDKAEVLVKKYMGDAALLTDTAGRGLATWRSEKQSRFDSKRFTVEHPTMAQEYRKEITFRTFRLK
jgi:predicted phage-related endonuclease